MRVTKGIERTHHRGGTWAHLARPALIALLFVGDSARGQPRSGDRLACQDNVDQVDASELTDIDDAGVEIQIVGAGGTSPPQILALLPALERASTLDGTSVTDQRWLAILRAQTQGQLRQIQALRAELTGDGGERWSQGTEGDTYQSWLKDYETALTRLDAALAHGPPGADLVHSLGAAEDRALKVVASLPELWNSPPVRHEGMVAPSTRSRTVSRQVQIVNCSSSKVSLSLTAPTMLTGTGEGASDVRFERQATPIELGKGEQTVISLDHLDIYQPLRLKQAKRTGANALQARVVSSADGVIIRIEGGP